MDNKKQIRCINCNYLYFKNLTKIPENFCSLDCKSSFNYREQIKKYLELQFNNVNLDSFLDDESNNTFTF